MVGIRLPLSWHPLQKQARQGWQRLLAFMHMVSRLTPYLRHQGGHLSIATACGLGYTVTRLLEPWPMKLIFDNVLLDQSLPVLLMPVLMPFVHNRSLFLNVLIAVIILLAIVRGVLYFYRELMISCVGQQVVADIRVDLYRHLQHLSFSFHKRRKTGDLLVRLTSDVLMIREMLVALLQSVISESFVLLGMAVVMLLVDWQLSVVTFAVIPPLVFFIRYYSRPMKQAARKQRKREGSLAALASEVLGAMQVIQGFTREKLETKRFQAHNKSSTRAGLRAARLEAKLNHAVEFSLAVGTATVLALGVRRVLHGALTPGDLLVFVAYLRAFYRPLRRLSKITERMAKTTATGERLLEILEAPSEVHDLPGAGTAPRFQGGITFEGVTFAYRKEAPPVLRGIDLRVTPGERVAIVGPTGSGKTTLVSLIPRFYDPMQGCVCIDGQDVRAFTLASLRKRISLVFQEPVLFAATVAENIAYGKPQASLEDIVRAAELAGIHSLIAALPEGYNTVIGERGGTLSGGQRQCVTIARAIIKDAPIVILDEPTAGLDSQATALVMEALSRLMQGRTVIMISHQLHTIQRMDRVVVLTNGCVEQAGSQEELLAHGGRYRALYDAQVLSV